MQLQKLKFSAVLSFWLGLTMVGWAQNVENGVAVIYSDGYQGKPTASGEIYDRWQFTASHRTLPFGTTVRITRLDNGRSTTVKINDRCAFPDNRILDLSPAAGNALDMMQMGYAQVRLEVLSQPSTGSPSTFAQNNYTTGVPTEYNTFSSRGPSSTTPINYGPVPPATSNASTPYYSSAQPTPYNNYSYGAIPNSYDATTTGNQLTPRGGAATNPVGGYALQLGAYSQSVNLNRQMAFLNQQGYQNVYWKESKTSKGTKIYKLYLGNFPSYEEAQMLANQIKQQLLLGSIVVKQ